MNNYNYSMNAIWKQTSDTPTILGERFLRTLELTAEAAPQIGEWQVFDRRNNELMSTKEARKIVTKLVEDNVATVDDEIDPDYGYDLLGVNTPTITPESISWSARVGGRFGERIEFETGFLQVPPNPEIVTYPLFRSVLLTTITLWPSIWANAHAYERGYYKMMLAPGVPPHPRSRYQIPWISYLSAPLIEGLVVPNDVLTERTQDGGLLMIAAEERLDPTNPEHMQRSRRIAEIMIARAGNHDANAPPVTPINLGQ